MFLCVCFVYTQDPLPNSTLHQGSNSSAPDLTQSVLFTDDTTVIEVRTATIHFVVKYNLQTRTSSQLYVYVLLIICAA